MLLQFFKHANGKFILLIFLFVLILRLGIGVHYGLSLIMVALAYLGHCISAVFINRVFTKNLLTKRYSFLPAFILILLTSTPQLLSYNSMTIPFVLFCLTLVVLSQIYPAERVNERIFNSGLIISSSIAINPIVALLAAPLVYMFQIIYGFNQLRRFFITTTALLVPIGIYYSIQFIVFNNLSFVDGLIQAIQPVLNNLTSLLLVLIYPLILVILSLFDLQTNFQHKKVLSRKFILLSSILGVVHTLALLFTAIPATASIFLYLPITMFIANYFEHIKATWIHHTLFILLLIISCTSPFILH